MGNRQRIAIYMRLSKADQVICVDKPGSNRQDSVRDSFLTEDSNSIQMQRAMLTSYVQGHFSNYQLLEFCDDGYSGTNFDRPGVMELLELVRELAIDCIVVKDFSRFSRDYIELGSYLEQILPFMGVRFISVNDGYDSKECRDGIGDIDVTFKHLLYDLYSKDLSVKVKSSLDIRKEKGQYAVANCPFGYEKAFDDRHRLVIVEDEAEIVRRIFSLTLEGYTSIGIAKKFNQEGVKTPMEYMIAKGKMSRIPKGKSFSWTAATVCSILKNEAYAGDMVYGKTERRAPGGRNHLKPRSEWKIFHNHHEPIVGREIFEAVQQSHKVIDEKRSGVSHPLIGTLACSCCGKNMIYRSEGLNPYFACPDRYVNPKENTVKKVNGMFLEQIVLFEVQQKILELEDMERLRAKRMKELEQSNVNLKRELLSLKRQKTQMDSEKASIYEQYREEWNKDFSGAATMNYHEKIGNIEEKLQEVDIHIQGVKRQLAQIEEQIYEKSDVRELIEYSGASRLSREIVRSTIEKIVVTDEEHIEILWRDFALS